MERVVKKPDLQTQVKPYLSRFLALMAIPMPLLVLVAAIRGVPHRRVTPHHLIPRIILPYHRHLPRLLHRRRRHRHTACPAPWSKAPMVWKDGMMEMATMFLRHASVSDIK